MTPIFNTGRVRIGFAYIRPAMPIRGDALALQAALLDKRSAKPLSLLARIAGAAWRWL